MKLCDKALCNGCMACVNVCSHDALRWTYDQEGFGYPDVIEERCTDCGRCEKICPVLSPFKKQMDKQQVYACWSGNQQLRMKSSSGGFFSELALAVLSQHGVVVGAAFNKDWQVHHVLVENKTDLFKIRGSKYVQSQIGFVYRKVKEILDEGRLLLFSGTPCQIAGLYAFLNKTYDNLITVDLVCHGVPSPRIFRQYVAYMEYKLKTTITELSFRDKRYSWRFFNMRMRLKNRKTYIGAYFSDPFLRGFLRDYFLRPACHTCQFTSTQRMGDVSMADYWGYKSRRFFDKNLRYGVSMIIVNNEKGSKFFQQIVSQLTYYPLSMDEAVCTNLPLSKPFPMPDARKIFWNDYHALPFHEVVKKWMHPEKVSLPLWLSGNFKYSRLLRIVLMGLKIPKKIMSMLNR